MNTRAIIADCHRLAAHLRLRSQVDGYLDGKLAGARRASVTAHLAVCRVCSDYAESVLMIKQSLRRADS